MFPKGIKFYDPEIVGDTPESVEWRGMQHLLGALGDLVGCSGRVVYAPDGSGAIAGWGRWVVKGVCCKVLNGSWWVRFIKAGRFSFSARSHFFETHSLVCFALHPLQPG